MEFQLNTSTTEQIVTHLKRCDDLFVPNLSSYVDMESYAGKLFNKAQRIEYFEENELLALLAFYVNLEHNFCFITNVSVDEKLKGKKIGDSIVLKLVEFCMKKNINKILLEVRKENSKAINFYNKHNFILLNENKDNLELQKIIVP